MRPFLLSILLPIIASAQVVKLHQGFYVSIYDLSLQCPRQVEWSLHSSDLGSSSREPSWRFTNDGAEVGIKATHTDYNHTGYHRGHLCPAQDRSASRAMMRSTFTMSNVAPQVPAINCGSWKRTENLCRAYATLYDSVCVVVCPVFLSRDTAFIGKHHLAVPHAFFKAVWTASSDSVLNAWFIFNH